MVVARRGEPDTVSALDLVDDVRTEPGRSLPADAVVRNENTLDRVGDGVVAVVGADSGLGLAGPNRPPNPPTSEFRFRCRVGVPLIGDP